MIPVCKRTGVVPSRRLEQGFSLMEILVVMAIVSVLAMMAVPHYLEYAMRVKVESELGLIESVRKAVTEEYQVGGVWPTDNEMALVADKDSYKGNYLESIEVGAVPVDGAITVTYNKTKMPALGDNNTIVYYPLPDGALADWACDEGSMINPYRPPVCRK